MFPTFAINRDILDFCQKSKKHQCSVLVNLSCEKEFSTVAANRDVDFCQKMKMQ